MNPADLTQSDMEQVTCQRPIIDKETGEITGWQDFQAARWVAEKQMVREHKLAAWQGVRLKPEQEPVKE